MLERAKTWRPAGFNSAGHRRLVRRGLSRESRWNSFPSAARRALSRTRATDSEQFQADGIDLGLSPLGSLQGQPCILSMSV